MSVATPRVLVVSESRITRRVVEMTFADQPLQLVTAASATNAASELKTRPPAVLLADIVLQGTDGFALARALRTHADGHKAVAILLAGQTELVDDAAVAAAQVSAVLRKPLDSHQLVDTVRQALRTGPPPAPAVAPAADASPATAGLALASVAVEPTPASAPQPLTLVPEPEPVVTAPLAVAAVAPAVAETAAGTAAGPASPAEGLADTFHALLEVEQGLRAPLAPAPLDDQDVERIAARVAGLLAADADRGARLDEAVRADAAAALAAAAERAVADEVAPVLAAAVEQAVRELAPALVERIAHAVVRDEIARLRGTARVA